MRGRKVEILSPKRGEKKKLLMMVKKNAEVAAENWKISKMKETERKTVLTELAEKTGISGRINRIEAYDISNISGEDSVAAMVVFENAKPARSKYRKFKIQTVEGSDDYSSMKEVLYRRFRHALEEEESIKRGEILREDAKFLPYPDMILIDGGTGHLNAVLEILSAMEVEIPTFGMVKDDRHRTRGIVSEKGEITFSPAGSVFKFITRVQDEVHRFAITYHRSLHEKEIVKSELDGIKGIGSARENALLTAFKSIDAIKEADVESLKTVVDKKSAEAVWNYFHKE